VAGAPSLGGIVRVLRVAAFAAYDVEICLLSALLTRHSNLPSPKKTIPIALTGIILQAGI
jgi:hypothetical protein